MAGIGAYEQAHLDELSSRPNTTVYTPEFDNVHDPWKVKQLKVIKLLVLQFLFKHTVLSNIFKILNQKIREPKSRNVAKMSNSNS